MGFKIPGIPNWEQFRKWSLPSQATYIALWIAIVCAPFAIIPGSHDFGLWVYDQLFGVSYEAKLLDVSRTMARFAVQNNTSRVVDVVDAKFDLVLYEPNEPVRRISFPVNVVSPDGTRSPFPVNSKSRMAVDVNERSLQTTDDSWRAICDNYRRRQFLRSIGQNQYRGGFFMCGMSIVLRESDSETVLEVGTNAEFAYVLERVVGSWRDYETPGGSDSAQESPSSSRRCK